MANNISVKFKDYEDRWHWVKRGIDLLREMPCIIIQMRPALSGLSWLYQHKIGQYLDDADMLYKLRWAQEMQGVLAAGPISSQLL